MKVKSLYTDFNCSCSLSSSALYFPQPSTVNTTCLNADLVENVYFNPNPHDSVGRNPKANTGSIMCVKATPPLPQFIRGASAALQDFAMDDY